MQFLERMAHFFEVDFLAKHQAHVARYCFNFFSLVCTLFTKLTLEVRFTVGAHIIYLI